MKQITMTTLKRWVFQPWNDIPVGKAHHRTSRHDAGLPRRHVRERSPPEPAMFGPGPDPLEDGQALGRRGWPFVREPGRLGAHEAAWPRTDAARALGPPRVDARSGVRRTCMRVDLPDRDRRTFSKVRIRPPPWHTGILKS